jgi:GNAT superfamily N-acetyltransferase
MTIQEPAEVTVRRLTADDTPALHDLRLRILRPGLPPDAAIFPGDEQPTTIHLGAFIESRCVGVLTLTRNNGLQLRGMAVDSTLQKRGVGAALLTEAHQVATAEGFSEIWCNARTSAIGFYERNGWRKEGLEFVITGVGPHYIMRRAVP